MPVYFSPFTSTVFFEINLPAPCTYVTFLDLTRPSNPEICILATKGKPKRNGANVDRLVVAERREHSRKPDRIRNDIVELCGDLPRIELFARQKFDGWDSWGNEV